MEDIKERIGSSGIVIPPNVIKMVGAKAGQYVSIKVEDHTIKVIPEMLGDKEIEKIATDILLNEVGDAVTHGAVEWIEEKQRWKVPVILSYRGDKIGEIYLDVRGNLIRKSLKREDLLKKAKEVIPDDKVKD